MAEFYKDVWRRFRVHGPGWWGRSSYWALNGLAYCISTVVFAQSNGWEAAMDEVAVTLSYGLAGPFVVGLLYLAYRLIAAVKAVHEEQASAISNLRSQLENIVKWSDIRQRLEVSSGSSVRADHTEGGALVCSWRITGDTGNEIAKIEPLVRIAGLQALRSPYCRGKLSKRVLNLRDPVDVWLETIHELTTAYRVSGWVQNELGDVSAMGSIDRLAERSALLCLDLESRELEASARPPDLQTSPDPRQ